MTSREQVLIGSAATVAVLFGGYQAIRSYIVAPRMQLQQDIRDAQIERESLEERLLPSYSSRQRWQRATSTTFSNDIELSTLAFRAEITRLLQANSLKDAATLTPRPVEVINKGPRAGFTTIKLGLKFDAPLQRVVSLLEDIYAAPYIKRVDQLAIAAAPNDVKPKRGKPSPNPTLGVTMTVSTLVLPNAPDKKLAATPFDPEWTKDPEWKSRLEPYLDEQTDFARVWQSNMFRLTEARERPKPPPVKVEKPVDVARNDKPEATEKPPPRPPVNRRPDADQFTLIGSTAEDGQPTAFVFDVRQAADPPLEFQLNDEFDDGHLVLIDPRCVVIRANERKPAGGDKFYIYANGRTFEERDKLTEQNYPEIWRLLQEVLAHSAEAPPAEGETGAES